MYLYRTYTALFCWFIILKKFVFIPFIHCFDLLVYYIKKVYSFRNKRIFLFDRNNHGMSDVLVGMRNLGV